MIDFWTRLDESDVEKYAKTLILPEYMSHLNLRPFSLSEQRESASGREPLTLLYVGDGRLEELELKPEKDALPLIASLDLGISVEKIQLPTSGAYWTWNDFGPSHPFFSRPLDSDADDAPTDEKTPNDKKSPNALRVYFEPRRSTFSKTLKFDAQDAYVSVSRREIFFSWRVLQAYLKARCLDLLVPPDESPNELDDAPDAAPRQNERDNTSANNAQPVSSTSVSASDAASNAVEPPRVDFAWDVDFHPFCENYVSSPQLPFSANDAASRSDDKNATNDKSVGYARPEVGFSPRSFSSAANAKTNAKAKTKKSPPPPFLFDYDDQNIRFRFGKIAGTLVVANDETFEDAFRFSGLKPTLSRLSQYVYYDRRNAAPRLDESGVRLRLTPVKEDANDDV